MGFSDIFSPSKIVRATLMKRAKQAVEKTHKQGRLKFIISDDNKVEYTNKQGHKEVMTIKNCAGVFWDILTRELEGKTGSTHSFAAYGISPKDIEGLIKGLR